MEIAGFRVTAVEVMHKGGRTFGYRVEDAVGSLAYLPDHAPVQGCSEELRAMLRGVDVLLHDAQFVESERTIADLFGHATIDEAIELATQARRRPSWCSTTTVRPGQTSSSTRSSRSCEHAPWSPVYGSQSRDRSSKYRRPGRNRTP